MAVYVTLAGRVGMEVDGVDVDSGGLGRPGRIAFAFLVSERHRPVPRDELADVVWGDDVPRSWEQLLRGIVSKLRSWLGAAGADPSASLITNFGTYQLHLPVGSTVDVEDAAAAVLAAEAYQSTDDPARTLEAAAAAVAVASRQFLPGGRGPWVERRQAELREVHVRALELVADAESALGHWPAAVTAAEEAIRLESFRESAFLRVMAAHAGAGNRGEALRAYERCRRMLADELGVGTSPTTEAAYLDLLGDEPSAPPTPAATAALPLPLPRALAAARGGFLVGRSRERQRLLAALERARGGGRQAVLVGGEPGIGKTALVAALAREAHADGARVLYGRCDEELGVAYQPFAEAIGHFVEHCPLSELVTHVDTYGGDLARLVPQLRRRLPDVPLPVDTDPEADRFRLFEAVAGLLAAASQSVPLVLVLDDLHWAANATLLLSRHILRAAGSAALLVVGTYRDTEVGPSHPFNATVADLRREPAGVERIPLDGLDEDGVVAFVEASEGSSFGEEGLAVAQALHVHTAGNPFFVGQLLQHLAESGAVYRREGRWSYYEDTEGLGVPEGVRDVVTRRLRRLGDATNRALVLAAVVGTEFDLDLLEAVGEPADAGGTLDAMDEALAGHLLVEVSHGHYRFSHALVRETIYSGLTATRRGRLHRRVGEAIEDLPGADDATRLPSLAHHFAGAASAGCAIKAADYALAAARQAVAQAAWEDAVARLEQGLAALALSDAPDLERRCDLLLLLAEAWTRFFDPRQALAAAAPAVEAARALGSPERLGRAAYWYIRCLREDRDVVPEAVAPVAEDALAALGDESPALRSRILTAVAGLATLRGELRDDLLEEALALARGSGDSDALGAALGVACNAVRGSPQLDLFLARAEELVTAAPPDGWDGWRNGHGMRAMGRLSAGDRAGFEADLAACERLGAERRFWYFQWNAALWQASLALLDGRFDEVEALGARARELTPSGLMGTEFFLRQMCRLRYERGDLAGAHDAAEQLVAGWPANPMHVAMRAFVAAERFGVDREREKLGSLVDHGLGPMQRERKPVTLAYRTELAVALGGVERAARLYAAFLPYRGQVVIGGMAEGCMGAVDRYLGMLAAEAGDGAAAARHYETALRLESGLGSPPLLARTRYWYARTLLAGNDPADVARAEPLVAACLETAERIGMPALADQASALLVGV